MNAKEKHIHQNLKNDWDNFPFKLDYLFYLLYCNNQNISDTHIVRTGNEYVVDRFRSMDEMHNNFEHKELTISHTELMEHLKITKSKNDRDFSYKTSIFSENHSFRCHKTSTLSSELIVFRFLDSSSYNLNQLSNTNTNFTPITPNIIFGEFNQEFTQLLDKYNLYDNLKESLDSKDQITEKRLKI